MAEEDLRVQQERYRLGASTILDLLTSQESLVQAENTTWWPRASTTRSPAPS